MNSFLCVFIIAASAYLVSAANMDTAYEWKYVDYLWPSESIRQEAMRKGIYNASNVIPMDVDKSKDGRVFVAVLGADGVPATLATVTEQINEDSGPLLNPYPDWSWFKKGDCNSITSVFRIAIDECSRLWVLDTGFLDGADEKCPPQLISFDLNTNRMIHRIKIPMNVAGNKEGLSMLATPIVSTEGRLCENTTIFMADAVGEGLVVLKSRRLFRLEHEVFRSKEEAKIVTVGNDSLDYKAGVVGMALSPRIFPGEARFLYFRPLSSFAINAAETRDLETAVNGDDVKFYEAENVLTSQAVGQAFSSEGTLFLGMTTEMSITCWNPYTKLTKENIVTVAQSNKVDYPNSLKVIPASYHEEEELWVLSNRLIYMEHGDLDKNVVNFRVLKAPVSRLVAGTKCYISPTQREEDVPIFNK